MNDKMKKQEITGADIIRATLLEGVRDGLCTYDPDTDKFSITLKGERYLKKKIVELNHDE